MRNHLLGPSYDNQSPDPDPFAVVKGVLAGIAISAMLASVVALAALEVRAWLFPW